MGELGVYLIANYTIQVMLNKSPNINNGANFEVNHLA